MLLGLHQRAGHSVMCMTALLGLCMRMAGYCMHHFKIMVPRIFPEKCKLFPMHSVCRCCSLTWTCFRSRLSSSIPPCKEKLQKQQFLLCKVVPLSDQFTFSIADINKDIIVFDGGNSSCPMMTPPKTMKWRGHHVSDLHIQDDLQGDIGLTFAVLMAVFHSFANPAILHLTS